MIFEYDRVQRAGELLQAVADEFLGTRTAPNATGRSESNDIKLYIVVGERERRKLTNAGGEDIKVGMVSEWSCLVQSKTAVSE